MRVLSRLSGERRLQVRGRTSRQGDAECQSWHRPGPARFLYGGVPPAPAQRAVCRHALSVQALRQDRRLRQHAARCVVAARSVSAQRLGADPACAAHIAGRASEVLSTRRRRDRRPEWRLRVGAVRFRHVPDEGPLLRHAGSRQWQWRPRLRHRTRGQRQGRPRRLSADVLIFASAPLEAFMARPHSMESGPGARALLWFRRFVWLGIIANVIITLTSIFCTEWVLGLLELEPAYPLVWPRFGALGILLLSGFYLVAARDPCGSHWATLFTVLCRFVGFIFFAIVGGRYLAFGLFDLVFGAPQAICLYLAWRRSKDGAQGRAPGGRLGAAA